MGRCTTLVPVPRGFSIHNNCQARPHWNPMVYIWMVRWRCVPCLISWIASSPACTAGCDKGSNGIAYNINTDCVRRKSEQIEFGFHLKHKVDPQAALQFAQLNDTIKIKLITPHENFETRQGHVQGSRSKARTRMKMTVTPPWVCTGIGGTHHWVQWLPNIFCGTIELILQFHLSIIYYHNPRESKENTHRSEWRIYLGKCHTIIRPCLSSTVLGSSKCPNWGLIKNLASSAVSSSPSGWGRLFFNGQPFEWHPTQSDLSQTNISWLNYKVRYLVTCITNGICYCQCNAVVFFLCYGLAKLTGVFRRVHGRYNFQPFWSDPDPKNKSASIIYN